MFKNLKLAKKLALGFALVAVITVLTALQGMHSSNKLGDMMGAMYDNNLVPIKDIANANMQAIYHNRGLYDLAIELDAAGRAKIQAGLDKNVAKMNELLGKYRKTMLTDKEKDLLRKFDLAWPAYAKTAAEVVAHAGAGRNQDAMELLNGAATTTFQSADDLLSDLVEVNDKLGEQAYGDAKAAAADVMKAALAMLAVAMLLCGLLGYWITRSVTKPLNQALKVAQTVAAGDLTSRIAVDTTDETGQLLLALRDMNASLVGIVGDVRGGTETIAAASQQLVAGNVDLSSRTEEQASSLEETASSMEEMTSTVRQNADSAREANHLAAAASEVALKGGAVVSEMVGIMGEINESARKVVDIIGVIDGIAFQTNILALNAAVEAARAGEQGRGFAVVAAEVRNLAQRSAAAAKEIKVLIDTSVGKVDAGARLADQAGATMQMVVESNRRVSEMISEISAASQEQTAGIEQINQAITQMDQVTQQNAALVEEQAAASESMQQQARKLAQVVSVFTVDPAQRAAAVTPAPAAPFGATAGTASARAGKPAGERAQPLKLVASAAGTGSSWEEF